jgi:hypothetical protein
MTCSSAKAEVLNNAAEMAEAARDKTVSVRRMKRLQVKKLGASIHQMRIILI